MRWLVAGALTILAGLLPWRVGAASFAAGDLQILGRAIAFMKPPPAPDALIAIAYAQGNAASRQDAEAIAKLIGTALPAGRLTLRAKVVDIASVSGGGFQIVIAAAGANGPQLSAAARAARALCVTTDLAAVRSGYCAMAITSEPNVEITLNHAVAAASGIEFAAAFRMMIQEI